MNSNKKTAKLIGIFFILAAVFAVIPAFNLYNPVLVNADYLTQGSEHASQVMLGALFELLVVVSAIGTATTMFPILKKYNETIALWHVCFRFLEAVLILIGVLSVLSLLTLSREFTSAAAPAITSYQTSGTLLKAVHDWTFLLGPNFMLGINTMMYSYIFYRSRLIPRFIPILGMTGAVLIFLCAILVMFDVIEQVSVWGGILAVPVAANEMILAIWLIIKGFNEPALTSLLGKKKSTD
ncbi:DUF4386 domain-containing protein [Peribacillus kribbensis]|uniref:DUF4386 domain-containing protein n=1 Tax=Peribacillus kribbensis TaxID=356658 RepID=UPI0004124B73|nr:DUF4386 domain-containing protein [Peribacillus kribbensis]